MTRILFSGDAKSDYGFCGCLGGRLSASIVVVSTTVCVSAVASPLDRNPGFPLDR